MSFNFLKQLFGTNAGGDMDRKIESLFKSAAQRLLDQYKPQVKVLIDTAIEDIAAKAQTQAQGINVEQILMQKVAATSWPTTVKMSVELAVSLIASNVDLGALAAKGHAALAPLTAHINDLIDKVRV